MSYIAITSLIIALIVLFFGAYVWSRSRSHSLNIRKNDTQEMIQNRPAQSALTINRFLDKIALSTFNKDHITQKGKFFQKILNEGHDPSNVINKKEENIISIDDDSKFSSDLQEYYNKINIALKLDDFKDDAESLLIIAQLTRLSLESAFLQAFEKPDAYSGALWAKTVGTGERAKYFIVCLMILDRDKSLVKNFLSIVNILSATGRRLPVSPEEKQSYDRLNQ